MNDLAEALIEYREWLTERENTVNDLIGLLYNMVATAMFEGWQYDTCGIRQVVLKEALAAIKKELSRDSTSKIG